MDTRASRALRLLVFRRISPILCPRNAHSIGARVIALTCCPGSAVDQLGDIRIALMPGAEIVTGSTRMKSGTAEKMVLNMLSTGTMIRLGKSGETEEMVKCLKQLEENHTPSIAITRFAPSTIASMATHVL